MGNPIKILAIDDQWDKQYNELFSSSTCIVQTTKDINEVFEIIDRYDGVIINLRLYMELDEAKDTFSEFLLRYIKANCPNLVRFVVTAQPGNRIRFLIDELDVDNIYIKGCFSNLEQEMHEAIINRYRKFKDRNGGNMSQSGNTFNINGNPAFSMGTGPAVGKIEGQTNFGDHAQFVQTINQQSSKDTIKELLNTVKSEMSKANIADDVKNEVSKEIDGAVVEINKQSPDKEKIADKLKTATTVLDNIKGMFNKAVGLGNMLGKAIEWCGEQWTPLM